MTTFLKTVKNTIRYWYVPAIIGVFFILIGCYLFTVPEATFISLVYLFTAFFLFVGIMETIFSIANHKELENWGWHLVSGLFTTLVGVLMATSPMSAANILVLFVGFSLLFRSIMTIGLAFDQKNYGIKDWGSLLFLGIIGVILSLFLIANPVILGLSIAIVTAVAFIVIGISSISFSVQLKRLKQIPSKLNKDLKDKIENLKTEYYTHASNI